MKYLDDVFLFVGCVLLVAGAWMVSVPFGLLVAGIICIVVGLVYGLVGGGEY